MSGGMKISRVGKDVWGDGNIWGGQGCLGE